MMLSGEVLTRDLVALFGERRSSRRASGSFSLSAYIILAAPETCSYGGVSRNDIDVVPDSLGSSFATWKFEQYKVNYRLNGD